MSEANLFNTARVRVGGKCAIIDMREAEAPQPCGYFIGKPADGPCKRCGLSWSIHYPARPPKRVRGAVAEVCDLGAQSTDSDAHLNHCGG
jgi:hypothetical protein